MDELEHERVLDDERAVQRTHRELLQKARERVLNPDPTTSNRMTGTGIPKLPPPDAEILGRLALQEGKDELDGHTDFYIGHQSNWVGEHRIYPWTSTFGRALFGGRKVTHEWANQIAVRRNFDSSLGVISDFEDEVLVANPPERPFRSRKLIVPKAPVRTLPTPTQSAPRGDESPARRPEKSATPSQIVNQPTIRAERLLRARLEAPRRHALSPALATMQPEQYDLVATAGDLDQIIEGQPGTGKTIIAAHRAAYLVTNDPDVEESISGDVLLVGPTRGYSRHVRDITNRLADQPERIHVLSLPELVQTILKLTNIPDAVSYSRLDADAALQRFVRSAVTRLKLRDGLTPVPEEVYDLVRVNGAPGMRFTTAAEWVEYLPQLPPFREALKRRRTLDLMAVIHWEVAKPPDLQRIDHIIVDEAQDVTGLEWALLESIHRGSGWTILGDLNQSRSDHTLRSWSHVIDTLGLESSTPVHRVTKGYRSTKPILEFANRLLPPDQRAVDALQVSGPMPALRKVAPARLMQASLDELTRLLDTYPEGTAAVITVDVTRFTKELGAAGWARDARDPTVWIRPDERRATIADADTARGLEFDGVVVVEPQDFPPNYGRMGPLYTSLTRPNRELAIVHSRVLPDALR